MIVGKRMKYPIITVSPDMPIPDALVMMRREAIRRVPVVKDNKLVGIVSDKDLLNASASPATTLSIWEMNYLLSKITVKEVMTKNVLTVSEDTPIEEAARIMADNKIGGLPVMRGDEVVGIITETDLFKVFLEMMGAREQGVRLTLSLTDKPGQIAKISQAIFDAGGNILALGTFVGDEPMLFSVTVKVKGIEMEKLRSLVEPLVVKVEDIRMG